VVARAGVANWWAPWRGSFYFDGEESAQGAAGVMGRIIRELCLPADPIDREARFTQAESKLVQVAERLESLLDDFGSDSLDQLHRLHEELSRLRDTVERAERGRGQNVCQDMRGAPTRRPARDELSPPVVSHLRHELESWRNTNYFKYLRSSLAPVEP
jgi:hypothetical protein